MNYQYDTTHNNFRGLRRFKIMSENKKNIKVWDLPTRLFHWSLVISVLACIITVRNGELDYHKYAGICVFSLIIFRIVWGIIGSQYAKFTDFIRGPKSILHYLKTGKSPTEGHNPAGAYMVLFMLTFLLWQSGSGLFASSDSWYTGSAPFASFISGANSEKVTKLHEWGEVIIPAMIGLHLLAIIVYKFLKKQNLVLTMITGRRKLQDSHTIDSQNNINHLKGDRPYLGIVLLFFTVFFFYAWLIAGWI